MMAGPKRFIVTASWDDEARVWVATSDDIPGLVTEAPTLDKLVERVVAVTPELLEDNAHLVDSDDGFDDLLEVCVQSKVNLHRQHAA